MDDLGHRSNEGMVEIPERAQRLALEVQAWVSGRERLWSPELDPGVDLFKVADDDLHRVREEIIAEVLQRRSELVDGSKPDLGPVLAGRELVYALHDSLAEGYAEVVTHGLFNYANSPPWDLWTGWRTAGPGEPGSSLFILSWIPVNLFGRVEEAIEATHGCLAWAPERREAP